MRATVYVRLSVAALAFLVLMPLPPCSRAASSDIETLYQDILQLDAAGRHDEALSQAKRLERLARNRFGPNHASYAYALGIEAWMLDEAGQTGDAEDLYLRALKLFGRTEGGDSMHIPQFLHRLGRMYRRIGRLPTAEQAYRLAVAIYEK